MPALTPFRIEQAAPSSNTAGKASSQKRSKTARMARMKSTKVSIG